MYLFDFFKNVARRANIPVFIYLIFNVFVIGGIVYFAFIVESEMTGNTTISFWLALLIGLGLYLLSLMIALSPIGEWILRLQTGCSKIDRIDQLEYLMPLFNEVKTQAQRLDPTIADDIQLFINDDEVPNAFATGRKTVCITEGMLSMPPEYIKATLAHEFGHLSHRDTDLILVVSVGNMIVTTLIFIIRLVVEIVHVIMFIASLFMGGKDGLVTAASNVVYHALFNLLVAGFMWLWTKIGTLLVMKSSRENEYEADEFAYELGYGNELCALLDAISGGYRAKGLFATLASSHPDRNARIARLQSLGSSHRAVYGGKNDITENEAETSAATNHEVSPPKKRNNWPVIVIASMVAVAGIVISIVIANRSSDPVLTETETEETNITEIAEQSSPAVIEETSYETTAVETTVETEPEFGSEILDLNSYSSYTHIRVGEEQIDAGWLSAHSCNNAVLYDASGYVENSAYADYSLESRFGRLTLRIQPYGFDEYHWGPDASAELQIINLDTNSIIHRETVNEESLPIDIDVDITGIDNLRIAVNHAGGGTYSYCVLSDIFTYPLEDGSIIPDTTVTPYGENAVNLSDIAMYSSDRVEMGTIPSTYTRSDRLWTSAFVFESESDDAWAIWEIGGAYTTLSLDYAPYEDSIWFGESAASQIQIINAETEEVLFSGSINHQTEILEVTADITGVNYLKINVHSTGNVQTAWCLVDNAYIYN